jgi:hypothetical protein
MPSYSDIIGATFGALLGVHWVYLLYENIELIKILDASERYNAITSNERWFSSYFTRENVTEIKFKNGIVYTMESMRASGCMQPDQKFVAFDDDKRSSEEYIVKLMIEVSTDLQISSVTFNTGTTIEVLNTFHTVTPPPPTSETILSYTPPTSKTTYTPPTSKTTYTPPTSETTTTFQQLV